MQDFYEIDFLNVRAQKSGDAITIRYCVNDEIKIHVVDGGFQCTGDHLVTHLRTYYNNINTIDHVVVTHTDADHTGSIKRLLEEFYVKELWMHRPWLYSEDLLNKFKRFTTVEGLTKRFKEQYANIAELEEVAKKNNTLIRSPFQGSRIGEFTVLAPSQERYLDLLVESDKTPEAVVEDYQPKGLAALVGKVIQFIKSVWGQESFPSEDTSPENNMSVIQYANICGKKILLTGDAGRAALYEAACYAPYAKLNLPGIDVFQVPHHGSRHNVCSATLDGWLGEKQSSSSEEAFFTAVISASEEDKDHPRKVVVRALMHRGAKVLTTEKESIVCRQNIPLRPGWSVATPQAYPDETEAD